MIDRSTFAFFRDELSKVAMSYSTGEKAVAGLGLAGAAMLGGAGKEVYRDAQEGRVHRLGRKLERRQQLASYKQGLKNG
jgi:hypothetical protein